MMRDEKSSNLKSNDYIFEKHTPLLSELILWVPMLRKLQIYYAFWAFQMFWS